MALGRWLPTSAGHAFARTVTGVLARRRDTSLYRTMRANQAGVLGPDASPEQLDAATRAVLGHAGMTAFDLMHIMAQGEDAGLARCGLSAPISGRTPSLSKLPVMGYWCAAVT